MDLQLKGNVAVVVGGARGIGLAIAREFAQEQCRVALIDRAAEVSDVAQSLGGAGYAVDATNYAELQAAAGKVVATFGRVDHLVFAVGIGSGKFGFPFWNLEPGDWGRVMEVNVMSAVKTLHAFTPTMIAAKSGTILLIASISGQ